MDEGKSAEADSTSKTLRRAGSQTWRGASWRAHRPAAGLPPPGNSKNLRPTSRCAAARVRGRRPPEPSTRHGWLPGEGQRSDTHRLLVEGAASCCPPWSGQAAEGRPSGGGRRTRTWRPGWEGARWSSRRRASSATRAAFLGVWGPRPREVYAHAGRETGLRLRTRSSLRTARKARAPRWSAGRGRLCVRETMARNPRASSPAELRDPLPGIIRGEAAWGRGPPTSKSLVSGFGASASRRGPRQSRGPLGGPSASRGGTRGPPTAPGARPSKAGTWRRWERGQTARDDEFEGTEMEAVSSLPRIATSANGRPKGGEPPEGGRAEVDRPHPGAVPQRLLRCGPANTSNVFSTLFPGRRSGGLRLTEPCRRARTGVEVRGPPGGKNLRRLSLLSGGEPCAGGGAALDFAIYPRRRLRPF